jgi:hypothetical protein
MKLNELNPRLGGKGKREYLIFDCPSKHENYIGNQCKVVIPIHTGTMSDWKIEGGSTFENISIMPSIWHHCEKDPHFFITGGEIVYA